MGGGMLEHQERKVCSMSSASRKVQNVNAPCEPPCRRRRQLTTLFAPQAFAATSFRVPALKGVVLRPLREHRCSSPAAHLTPIVRRQLRQQLCRLPLLLQISPAYRRCILMMQTYEVAGVKPATF